MRKDSIAGGVMIGALYFAVLPFLGSCSVLLDGRPKPADASEDVPPDDGAAGDEASHDPDADHGEDALEEPAEDLGDPAADAPDQEAADEEQEPPIDAADIETEDVPCEAVVTLETIFAEKDTYISSYDPTMNFGDAAEMLIFQYGAGPVRQSLVQFNLAHISPGMRIAEARLILVYTDWDGNLEIPERPAGAYEILTSWSENDVKWEGRPTFSSTSEGTINLVCCNENVWDVTDLVRRWVATPASNFGVMISPEAVFSYHFGTMQHTDTSRHPRLEVDVCL